MRILTALSFYRPHWTGLTVHAAMVAEGLARRGHQVSVLTTRHSPALPSEEVIEGVNAIRLEPVARFSRGMVMPGYPLAAARMIAAHDVVQIHTPLPEALLIATLCRVLRKPMLMTHHGDVVMPSGPMNRLVEHSAYWVLRGAGALATGATSYSRDYADSSRLLRALGSKVECVYPPVDIPPPDLEAARRWRRELGLEESRVIGFAGRWVEEKGFDDLLRALSTIVSRVPSARLVYAGDPHVVYEDFFARCQPLVERWQDRITFVGLVSDRQRMADFYAMCDVFALPSRTEMMALVQVEAMLCGTPVVASDIPGARVVIREVGGGRLAPARDPVALACAITEVLEQSERYRPSPERVRAAFDPSCALDRYEALLQGMLRTRATSAIPHAQPHEAAEA